MDSEHVLYIKRPGPRPAFHLVAEHLWGAGCNYDSDGNSMTALDGEWTELTVALRGAGQDEQLSIDHLPHGPLVLVVRSPSETLCARATQFIVSCSGGAIEQPPDELF